MRLHFYGGPGRLTAETDSKSSGCSPTDFRRLKLLRRTTRRDRLQGCLTDASVSAFRKISETRARVGCQGWNYDDWVTPPPPARAVFYPRGTRADRMLDAYARAFDTVEVDSTFYAVPSDATFDGWARRTPDGFTFALKLPREITHEHALRGARPAEVLEEFCRGARRLGGETAAALRQRPPPSSGCASAARRSSRTSATSTRATPLRAPTSSSACSASPRSGRMNWRISRHSFELRNADFGLRIQWKTRAALFLESRLPAAPQVNER